MSAWSRTSWVTTPGGYHGIFSDGMPGDYGGISSYGSTLSYQGSLVPGGSFGVSASRGQVVGKNHGWSAEDVILQLNTLIYCNVVLYLNMIANFYIVGDINVLSKGAVFPDYGSALNVTEVPDFCTLTDVTFSSM